VTTAITIRELSPDRRVIRFDAIATELTATADRQALLRNRRFRRQVFEALDRLVLSPDGTPGLLSLDVFDTLLLRDGSSQLRRFGEIGARMAARVGTRHEAGGCTDRPAPWHARQLPGRTARGWLR
jgi:hypothetical protein